MESLLCDKVHSLHVFSYTPHDHVVRSPISALADEQNEGAQDGQGRCPGHEEYRSDALLGSVLTYRSFLHSVLPLEGLEGVGNTEPSTIGWLKVKKIATHRTGWIGRLGRGGKPAQK